jgi:phosphatidylserine decarboxylase
VIDTADRGTVLYLEIGATCVGSVIHTAAEGTSLAKGAEKGYFRFGGSCVTTLFLPDQVVWDSDLVQQAAAGREVYARVGERMACWA